MVLAGSIGGSATQATWSASTGIFSSASSLTTSYTPSISSGVVTLILTTDNPIGPCPQAVDSLILTVNPIPNVNGGNNLVTCDQATITLTATGASSYSWTNGVVNGVSFVPPLGLNQYIVTGVSAAGCVSNDTVTVFVQPLPEVTFSADKTSGCPSTIVQFTSSTEHATNCIWYFSDGTSATGCGTVPHQFNASGCFDVTLEVQGTNGCYNSATLLNYICIDEKPIANFNPANATIDETNSVVHFFNTSVGASSFSWSFGDNTPNSTLTNPSHDYNGSVGTYPVTLIAISSIGCKDSVVHYVKMVEPLIYYVPNCFTPDGNESNQTFTPVFHSGFDPSNYHLSIYNRWGELIFESLDAAFGWDGTYQGEIVQNGSYTWQIDFKLATNGGRRSLTGLVTLIR